MSEIFAPLADDKFAAPLSEYALVKSSGYLNPQGVGPFALEIATAYAQSRGGRVIVSRPVGSIEWTVVEQIAPETVDIPDSLPDDFS